MRKIHKLALPLLVVAGVIGLSGWYLATHDIAILNPKGTVADQQKDLLITATLLMLIVVVPVFLMVLVFSLRYRESNKKAKYTPDAEGSRLGETIWWLVPLAIISVLSVIIWRSSHSLDPFKPLASDKKPLTIQVVALEWKWLFIYPEQDIASVNFIQIPEDTPINFEITADAPMNSFWIPQLGGQIYAMPGMQTDLHLQANEPGEYRGSSANISGKGFAGMKFTAKAGSEEDFKKWVESVKNGNENLTETKYAELAKPSEDNPVALYSSAQSGIFHNVIMRYMTPSGENQRLEHQLGSYETEAAHGH